MFVGLGLVVGPAIGGVLYGVSIVELPSLHHVNRMDRNTRFCRPSWISSSILNSDFKTEYPFLTNFNKKFSRFLILGPPKCDF